MIFKQLNTAWLALAALLISVSPSLAQNAVAIKGARILTMAGEPIEGGTVLIRDGKITAVGTDVEIPVEARVIDATGKVVMPGFVEPHTAAPLSQANESNPNVPYISVLDGIDPMRTYFEEARRNGVTTVSVVPGNTTMIGGQAAIIKTGGTFIDYMILKRDAGIKISLQPSGQSSRMSHLAALRFELDKAKKLRDKKSGSDDGDSKDGKTEEKKEGEGEEAEGEEKEEGKQDEDAQEDENKEKSESTPSPAEAAQQAAMMKLVTGELPAFIYCQNAMDVGQAIMLSKEYGLKPILVLNKDTHKAAKQVAAADLPAILDSTLVFWETDPRTDEDSKIVLSEIYRQAGIPFAFQVASSSNRALGTNYLWYQAATAVKYGMKKTEALQALTIGPAKMLGVDEFVGSLEPGKDGDVIILSGEPLDVNTWVDTTIVNGEVVYERENDIKLQRLLEGTIDE